MCRRKKKTHTVIISRSAGTRWYKGCGYLPGHLQSSTSRGESVLTVMSSLKSFTKSFTFCKGITCCSPFPSYLPGFLPIFPPRYDFAGGQVSNSTSVSSSWHILFITCAHLGREMCFLFPWERFFTSFKSKHSLRSTPHSPSPFPLQLPSLNSPVGTQMI